MSTPPPADWGNLPETANLDLSNLTLEAVKASMNPAMPDHERARLVANLRSALKTAQDRQAWINGGLSIIRTLIDVLA